MWREREEEEEEAESESESEEEEEEERKLIEKRREEKRVDREEGRNIILMEYSTG